MKKGLFFYSHTVTLRPNEMLERNYTLFTVMSEEQVIFNDFELERMDRVEGRLSDTCYKLCIICTTSSKNSASGVDDDRNGQPPAPSYPFRQSQFSIHTEGGLS